MTERQRRFIPLYVKLGNASEAARQAGYKEKNADNVSWRLMQKPEILAGIKELMDKTYNISLEEYAKKTIQLHTEETNKSVKARYWELLGDVKGYRHGQDISVTVNNIGNSTLENIRNRRLKDNKLPIVSQFNESTQDDTVNKVTDNDSVN